MSLLPRRATSFVAALLLGLAASSAEASLIDGLVAYYAFEDGGDLGADTADAVGGNGSGAGGFDGFGVAGPSQIVGRVGSGLELDGTSQYVRVDGLPLLSDFTVQAWIRADDTAGNQNAVQMRGNFGLYEIRSGGSVTNVINDGAWQFYDYGVAPSLWTDGSWHHVAMSYDGTAGEIRVYVDGALDSVTPQAGGPTTGGSPFWLGIGTNGGYANAFFDGGIDEVAIWERALSDPEIGQLFTTGSAGIPVPEAQTGWQLALGLAALGVRGRSRRR